MAQDSLSGRFALVTGSTSGIGNGVAHKLASKGCSVVLTGLATQEESQKLLHEFNEQYSGKFHFVPGNFLTATEIENFCKDVLSVCPQGVDILINNAGVPGRGSTEELPTEVWLNTLSVNLTAPFLLIKTFLPFMKQRGWGRIINMSSQMGLIGEAGKAAYCTTKSGLIGLSRVIALEGAQHGVTCNAVCPGFVDAPMGHSIISKLAEQKGISFEESKVQFESYAHPSGRLVPLQEVVDLIHFLCSNSASSITGSPIPIDGGNMAR